MKFKLLLFGLLFNSIIWAQNWAYVGNSAISGNTVSTQSFGSAKTVFKSDGTPISVSLGGNPSVILPKTFNGAAWVNLGTFTTTGIVGSIDLEIYNNEPYVAYYNAGLKVKKYNGTNWVDVGLPLPGYTSSTNFDFAIDNAGALYVACFDRKIFKYNGSAWSLIYTLPQTVSGSILYAYSFTQDKTLTFNASNDLVYNVATNHIFNGAYKQFVKRYNGVSESIVGDTIIYNAPFTSYTPKIYTNSMNELFTLYHKPTSNNVVVKKFNGTNWITYGDTSNFRKNLAQASLAFTSPTSFVVSGTGQARKIYSCAGQTSSFQTIDTLNVMGSTNFAQITDLSINPINNEIYATFNSIPASLQDYSVMKHGPLTTGINDPSARANHVILYPNPATDYVYISGVDVNDIVDFNIINLEGKKLAKPLDLMPGMCIGHLAEGIYFIEIRTKNNETFRCKFIKE